MCYTLQQVPGFFFFPGGISESLQSFLEYQSLQLYCRPPFRTNLDQLLVTRTKGNGEHVNARSHPSHKLSWATLGYHYNWSDRSYSPEDVSKMPMELQVIAQHFAVAAMQHSNTTTSTTVLPSYQATACIVNYYTTKSVMGGHRDDVEEAVDKPVVSISLGQRPAVFIVGGSTLDATPVIPMVVRPGDVVVLSGKSRLSYHSMARLLPRELPVVATPPSEEDLCPEQQSTGGLCLSDVMDEEPVVDEDIQCSVLEFLKDRRININLRQVYPRDTM